MAALDEPPSPHDYEFALWTVPNLLSLSCLLKVHMLFTSVLLR